MLVDYSKQRSTFGQPIADRQAIQWMIADAAVEIQATKWLAFHAAWQADQGRDNRHEASMAKLFGSNMVNRVVDRVMQIHGGMDYTKEMPIERWYRDMRVTRINEGKPLCFIHLATKASTSSTHRLVQQTAISSDREMIS